MPENKRIVVIGATGHFGGRFCRRILNEPNALLIVTSRSQERANALASELRSLGPRAEVTGFQLDVSDPNFEADLASLRPNIVIHTAGPYQNQDYRVPQGCIVD